MSTWKKVLLIVILCINGTFNIIIKQGVFQGSDRHLHLKVTGGKARQAWLSNCIVKVEVTAANFTVVHRLRVANYCLSRRYSNLLGSQLNKNFRFLMDTGCSLLSMIKKQISPLHREMLVEQLLSTFSSF